MRARVEPAPGAAAASDRLRALGARVGRARVYLAIVAAIFLFSWVMMIAAWLLLPSARSVELRIPPGTAVKIAGGELVSALPDALLLRRGDRLIVVNEDVTVHRIGPLTAPPGRSSSMQVNDEFFAGGSLVCSFHPGGAIGVASQARRGLSSTLLPALLLALPLAFGTVVAVAITRRLDVED